MATEEDREAAGTRYVLLSALLVATVVSTAAFGRVYQGEGTTLRLVLVAVISLAVAAGLERRQILIAATVSAAGLILAVTWLVFPETSSYGLPTVSTLRSALDALSAVGQASAAQVAPAAPIAPLLVAGVVAAWAAPFASHSLATRGRSPFLAIVPPAALIAFAGIIMREGSRPGYVFVFVAAALGILFADSLRRVGAWGPVTLWHGKRKLRVGSGTTARGAWRVAAVCVGVATFLPWLLPGFGAAGLLSLQGGPAQPVSINPIVDIKPQLLQHPATRLLQVRSPKPTYWRFATDDLFDGRVWRSSNATATGGLTISSGRLNDPLPSLPCVNPASHPNLLELRATIQAPRSCPTGYPDAGPQVFEVHQQFTFGPLHQPWLPASSNPITVGVSKGTVKFDSTSQILFAPDGTFNGYSYDVTSLAIVPTPVELNAESNLVDISTDKYLQLPSNMPPAIARIARQWTAGTTTPYEKIIAIQSHLLRFRYDQNVKFQQGTNDLLYFLTVARRGFCEQFAGAMAVLLRSIGIPARVAVGFTPGSPDPKSPGTWNVTTQNAHAWVEVPFPDYGWLQFEPTPGRLNPVASAYDVAPAFSAAGQSDCLKHNKRGVCVQGPASTPSSSQIRSRKGGAIARGKLIAELRQEAQAAGAAVQPATIESRVRWWALRLVLLALVAVALVVPAWKFVRRRALMAGAHAPRDRALAAYRALLSDAADLGFGRRSHETVQEYSDRLHASVPFANGHLDRLTRIAERAAYADAGCSQEDAVSAERDSRRVTRDLRHATPAARRLIGLFRVERKHSDAF